MPVVLEAASKEGGIRELSKTLTGKYKGEEGREEVREMERRAEDEKIQKVWRRALESSQKLTRVARRWSSSGSSRSSDGSFGGGENI